MVYQPAGFQTTAPDFSPKTNTIFRDPVLHFQAKIGAVGWLLCVEFDLLIFFVRSEPRLLSPENLPKSIAKRKVSKQTGNLYSFLEKKISAALCATRMPNLIKTQFHFSRSAF